MFQSNLNANYFTIIMQLRTYLLCVSVLLFSSYSIAQIPALDWPIEVVSEGHGFTEGPTLAQDGKGYRLGFT